jgi:uncharacterized protein
MLLIRIIFSLVLFYPVFSHADELTEQKKADIKTLMEMTGSTKIAMQFADTASQNIFHTLKMARPDIPERVLTIFHKELLKLFEEKIHAPDGMMERLIPIYARHFTAAEIKELLAFYNTRVGRKSIETLPMIFKESMAVGQEWGQSLAPEINRRVEDVLKKEGIDFPKK